MFPLVSKLLRVFSVDVGVWSCFWEENVCMNDKYLLYIANTRSDWVPFERFPKVNITGNISIYVPLSYLTWIIFRWLCIEFHAKLFVDFAPILLYFSFSQCAYRLLGKSTYPSFTYNHRRWLFVNLIRFRNDTAI